MHFFYIILIFNLPKVWSQGLLSVTTSNGTIQGGKCSTSSATQFLGIPYAEPPVGSLRFKPPKPYSAGYNRTFQATTTAVSCIQFGPPAFGEAGPTSEDCLTLDIWVPPTASSGSQLPVKIWIFGGAGVAGGISDPLYNGCNLASESIVVSINYRVGPLGFLALPSAGIQGNMAVQDVILGLEWVQDNIANFGGDPKKVLVFGEANGAELVFILSTLPNASSLMHSIACESGGGRNYAPSNLTTTRAFATNYVQGLGCNATDISCIQNLSISSLNNSIPPNPTVGADNEFYVTKFDFLVDGQIIPKQPADVGTNVPAIFGWTTAEGTIVILPDFGFPPSEVNYSTFLVNNFGAYAQQVNQTYPLSKFSSLPYPVYSAMVAIVTDYAYICRSYLALTTASKKGVPSYVYVWGQPPTCPWYGAIKGNQIVLQLLGATHTAEVPFVFNNTINLPLPNGTCSFTDFEKNLSVDFVHAYTSMAINGTPNGLSSFNWPAFSNSTAYTSMGLNVGNGTVNISNIDFSVCQFWDTIDADIFANWTNPSSTNSSSPSGTAVSTSSSSSRSVAMTVLPTTSTMLISLIFAFLLLGTT